MAPSGARKRKREVLNQTKKASTESNDLDKPKLLKLPGEIRNKIWAHTFDYYDYVNCGRRIDMTCFRKFPKMPSAAAVCRQMLAEILGVFLNETTFVIWVDDCEGERDVSTNTAYMRLCNLQHKIGRVEEAPEKLSEAPNAPGYRISGRPNFGNIIKWAKSIHTSDVDLTYDTDEMEGWPKVLYEMLHTAVKLRSVPWVHVKEVLRSMQRIAAIDHYEWVIAFFFDDLSSEYSHYDFDTEDYGSGEDVDLDVYGDSEDSEEGGV